MPPSIDFANVPSIFHDPKLDTFVGGWIPTPPDPKDALFPRLASPARASLAHANHDLRNFQGQSLCMPVGNQGRVGSCTAWAWSYSLRAMLTTRHNILTQRPPNLNDTLSPRFAYDMARSPEFLNTYPGDSGADLLTGGAVLLKYGCPPESDMPYSNQADNGPINAEMTEHVLEAARFYGISGYYRLQGEGTRLIDSVLQCLDEGFPCVLTLLVPPSFEQCPGNGRIPTPRGSEQILGGHMVACVGNYLDNSFPGGGCCVIQNQWGKNWGDVNGGADTAGYAYIPFSYFTTNTRYGPWLQGAATAR